MKKEGKLPKDTKPIVTETRFKSKQCDLRA